MKIALALHFIILEQCVAFQLLTVDYGPCDFFLLRLFFWACFGDQYSHGNCRKKRLTAPLSFLSLQVMVYGMLSQTRFVLLVSFMLSSYGGWWFIFHFLYFLYSSLQMIWWKLAYWCFLVKFFPRQNKYSWWSFFYFLFFCHHHLMLHPFLRKLLKWSSQFWTPSRQQRGWCRKHISEAVQITSPV